MSQMDEQLAQGLPVEGQHEHTLDGKGRMSIPAEFRGSLALTEGSELVVTRHLKERCLLVFWPESWDAFKEAVGKAPPQVSTALSRIVCGSSRRVRLDKLGRIQIPSVLRKYADLDGKCSVLGQRERLEIWSMAVWDETHGPQQYQELDLSEFML